MRIIVTGCAGFIGSHLCENLLNAGHKVLGIDSLAHNGKLENMLSFIHQKGFAFMPINLAQIYDGFIRKTLYEFSPDVVVHLAALNSIQKSVDSPQAVMQANVNDSYTLFDLARVYNWKRIVFASSSSVYGESHISQKTEGQEGKVSSMYALSKVFLEDLAHVHQRSYGIDFVGLRFFNVFGPRQVSSGPYAPVIAKWVQSGVCEINGDGGQGRDYTHVENAVDAIHLALNTDAVNECYNVGCGESTTLVQLAHMLGFKDSIVFKEARANEVRNSYASLSKASKYLKYEPKVSLEEGLKKMGLWKSFSHV